MLVSAWSSYALLYTQINVCHQWPLYPDCLSTVWGSLRHFWTPGSRSLPGTWVGSIPGLHAGLPVWGCVLPAEDEITPSGCQLLVVIVCYFYSVIHLTFSWPDPKNCNSSSRLHQSRSSKAGEETGSHRSCCQTVCCVHLMSHFWPPHNRTSHRHILYTDWLVCCTSLNLNQIYPSAAVCNYA